MDELHIGQALKIALIKRNISHGEFARKVGRSKQWVSKIVKKRTIQVGLLLQICETLNADLGEFLPERFIK